MPQIDFFRLFTDPLNSLGVRYMVVGSVAGMMYGEPRLTLDVDIVLKLPEEAAERLCELFGPDEFYCPPLEVVRVELARPVRGHFNLIHHDTGFKADIYLVGRQDELNEWGLENAVESQVEGHTVRVAPVECVILGKLEFYRESHSERQLRDIRSILKVSGDRISQDWLKTQIARMGLDREWATVTNSGT
jgi:hypothetical protein